MLRVNDTYEFTGLGVSQKVENIFSQIKGAITSFAKPSAPAVPAMSPALAPTQAQPFLGIGVLPIVIGVGGLSILAWALFMRKR